MSLSHILSCLPCRTAHRIHLPFSRKIDAWNRVPLDLISSIRQRSKSCRTPQDTMTPGILEDGDLNYIDCIQTGGQTEKKRNQKMPSSYGRGIPIAVPILET